MLRIATAALLGAISLTACAQPKAPETTAAAAPATELPTTAFLAKHLRENLWFYLVLIAGGVLMVAPFVWMVSTALKPAADQFSRDLIPRRITFENFGKAWELMEFQHLVWNSFRIAALSTIGQVVTCSMGAGRLVPPPAKATIDRISTGRRP